MEKFQYGKLGFAILLACFGMSTVSALAQNTSKVVYPGQAQPAAGPQKSATQGQPTPVQQSAPPVAAGQPGQTMAQLPPLPAVNAKPPSPSVMRPGSVAANDVVPPALAEDAAEVKRRLNDFARAQNTSYSAVAKPVTRTVTVSQAAGEQPTLLRLAMGIPSNIVFIDGTGQPWPIDYAVAGDAQKFEILMPDAGTSSMQIRPVQNFAYGGVSVKLKGNHIPVSFTLTVGQPEVDARLDVKISRSGPNAAAPIIDRSGQPHATDAALSSFLDGVPPDSAQEAKTSLKSVRVWRWNGKMIIRSDHQVVSPAWTDSTSSPSGVTNAYVVPDVPSILVANEGRLVTVKID